MLWVASPWDLEFVRKLNLLGLWHVMFHRRLPPVVVDSGGLVSMSRAKRA